MKVPHAFFHWTNALAADAHPDVGDEIARAASSACAAEGFEVSNIDLWRDVGWSFNARFNRQAFEFYYARHAEGVLLAVAPPVQGSIARLFGSKPTTSTLDLMRLCRIVHGVLERIPAVTDIRWMLGGPPERVKQVASPDELAIATE